jgi:hypothetical protein
MDQMQQELQATYPLLRISLLGINEPNQEGGNAGTTNGRDIPWIQDVDVNSNGRADAAMDLWQMAFRDVVILDGQNQKVGVYNLNQHDLANSSDYNTLKQMLIDAAMTSQKPWRNPANPLDVDNNGVVVPLDVLRIVNVLNESGPRQLPPPVTGQSPPPFLDPNGDGNIAPSDALMVINWLNSQSAGQGEGEAMAINASPDAWSATSWGGGLGEPGLSTVHLESPLPADRVLIDSPLADGYAPVRSPDDAARITAVDRVFAEDDATKRKDESCQETDPDWFDLPVFSVPAA